MRNVKRRNTLPAGNSQTHKGYGLRRRMSDRKRKSSYNLTQREIQRANRLIASQYNLDFLFKTAPKSVYDEHGHIILDPNNPADRRWMED